MKIQTPKTKIKTLSANPELTIWLLRIGLIMLYTILFIYKKKLYM